MNFKLSLGSHGHRRISDQDGHGGGIPKSDRKTQLSQTSADQFFREFAAKRGFGLPAKIFFEKREKRIELLNEFCLEALKSGNFTPGQIADAIITWRYPAKISRYVDVSKDQAAIAIVLGITSKVNLFDMMNGDVPIVENGKLLNGVFGRFTTNHMIAEDTVADVLYLTEHALEHNLPQPPLLLFLGRTLANEDFEGERTRIVQARDGFEKELGNLIVERHRFKIPDPHHESTVKFRLLCTIWNCQTGRLMVTGRGMDTPIAFTDWVGSNLNDILSASDSQLNDLRNFSERSGLIEKLRNPRNGADGYAPWADLLKQVEQCGGVTEPITPPAGVYRQAVKIWRHATLQIAVENVKKYEANWENLRIIREILDADTKLACNDGRQSGGVKALAGILTEKEFRTIFGDHNPKTEILRFVPHYGCGFLTATHQIHLTLQRLMMIIGRENDFEKKRMTKFFEMQFKRIAGEKKSAPVDWLSLRDYLPQHLKDELTAYVKGNGTENPDNRKFVETLHSLFSGGDEKLRRVMRRGIETGIFEVDKKSGFVMMTAARTVHDGLYLSFGDEYHTRFSFNQINSLVIEEAARNAYESYRKWVRDMPNGKRLKLEFFMDNFQTGQATVVPEKPESPSDFGYLVRDDYYLSRLTPQEVSALDLQKMMTWGIPK